MLAPLLAVVLSAILLTDPSATRAASPRAEAPAVTQVMILGAYHFDNPGLDLANMKADDPTSPRRQAEIARIAAALARFRPTKIMVERVGPGPRYETTGYPKFAPADVLKDKDEGVQIGYRLARQLGQTAVYGIDERDGPGKPDYFPFDKTDAWAKAHGAGARTAAVPLLAKTHVAQMDAAQKKGIADALIYANSPEAIGVLHTQGSYGLLSLGHGDEQPGADFNAAWYLRNAKIFAKLMQASDPGDRVLVVFGAGHKYWLDHFARETPGFALVDPIPYLQRAR